MPARGQTSILQVDQDARKKENIAWHRAQKREEAMVASDSTIFRSLAGMDQQGLCGILLDNARQFLKEPQSKIKLPSGKTAQIGSLDGTCMGRYPANVLTVLGAGKADQVIGYRMSPGTGHELATSKALEETSVERLGEGYIDYLAKDALYVNRTDLKRARSFGYDLVTKTEDRTLKIIQKVRPTFYWPLTTSPKDLTTVRGVDSRRGCTYRITCSAQLTWQGQQVNVAHVKREISKPETESSRNQGVLGHHHGS